MLTFLTAYFWIIFAIYVFGWLRSIFTQPTLKPIDQASSKTPVAVYLGMILGTVLILPLTYLHSLALPVLNLPAWLAWAVAALNLISLGTATLVKKSSVSGAHVALNAASLALAWHGLHLLAHP